MKSGEVLPAGFQVPLCESLSGTYLGDVSSSQGLFLAFARPETQFLWALKADLLQTYIHNPAHIYLFQLCPSGITHGKSSCQVVTWYMGIRVKRISWYTVKHFCPV